MPKYDGPVQPMSPDTLRFLRENYFAVAGQGNMRSALDAARLRARFNSGPDVVFEATASEIQPADADSYIEASAEYVQRHVPQPVRDAWWAMWNAYRGNRKTSNAVSAWRIFLAAHDNLIKAATKDGAQDVTPAVASNPAVRTDPRNWVGGTTNAAVTAATSTSTATTTTASPPASSAPDFPRDASPSEVIPKPVIYGAVAVLGVAAIGIAWKVATR